VQLEGNLAQLSLRELIEMITYSSVKGMLEVHDSDLTAQLYFSDGQPCHAIAGDLRGIDAVGRMFEMHDASFRFYAGSQAEDETLWYESSDLIRRGEDLARGWARIRPLIPSHLLVPSLTESGTAPRVQLDTDLWPVLAAVDGQRSILAISEQLGSELYSVCSALAALKQQGLVTIDPPSVQPMPPSTPAPQQKQGFFERLIERTLEEDAQNPGSRYAPPEQRYVETE
jgi:Domain of unknown function (DUF4388)